MLDLVVEVERLRATEIRVREVVGLARHTLHLTGELDGRELLQHIRRALEEQS